MISFPGFKPVPKTGVIFVMTEASRRGFNDDRELWSNLGQGAPETGDIPGSPSRLTSMDIKEAAYEYAPVGGLRKLREAVARLYNERYRLNKKSQYTAENVAIGSGGRLALTRVVSTLGASHVGHFLPDYTAYEELLGSFGTFTPIPISLSPENSYYFSPSDLEKEILSKGLSTLLLSNPANPTGNVIKGNMLEEWINTARDLECALLFDEFYSHYLYNEKNPGTENNISVSAAEFIEDVNKDPVIIFDGLTKNWRYPGLRISWTLGPAPLIEAVTSAGSFLDGGASHPTQQAIIPLLDRKHADQEAISIQNHFSEKKNFLYQGLKDLGVKLLEPAGGFYCWGDLSGLPPSLRSGYDLFEALLKKKTIIVPGVFFDINPGKRRPKRSTRFNNFARFSFGPPRSELERGLETLAETIKEAS
ncbi:MAG TPA: pyridoxal phosphate-dependent aminotransferase [Oligoflexia bacterium]|nr:pyridoxal phosphate-dependent aminotransferase [Oligoflexia bacterium]HMP48254.1 pyridoxal phosphate-dependent aminotransferase [Oligoflexia bacterium]